MNIFRVQFSGYNRETNQFAKCFILIQEQFFNISKVNKISISNSYYICSEIKVDKLINHLCEQEVGDFLNAYQLSKKDGFSFTAFPDSGSLNMNFYRVPRFGENDFEEIIKSLGGKKIPETTTRTPDFLLDDILLEFKDLQKESLENNERQKSIAKHFENIVSFSINIDPSLDFGELTHGYHKLIKNTIKNNFKSASNQIKTYRVENNMQSAGIILFNTGLHSLPHELFKEMVVDILNRETQTIEFAYIFSQKMQTNGWDMYAIFMGEWIGNIPIKLEEIKNKMDELVNIKMTEMMHSNNSIATIESQKPISFEMDNKIFFWNPGQIKFPWDQE
ncbi:hypothetical protein NAT51_16665 [Flavobacterium amniphilum]|uniref:hypothetical protein n=1 Tax=Flavobacterium amniphilum TaxID=1834035 RepID=UPI00202A7702|nr:hypothetical protein [Flavobacterium amniphilum]MCL9807168.1 hypothetical protein [Flavobacterium amniphilum]